MSRRPHAPAEPTNAELQRQRMKIGWVCGFVAALWSAPFAHAQGAVAAAPAADSRRLQPEFAGMFKRGELVVAMLGTDTPPFFYVADKQLQGSDVAMALALGKSLGLPVRFDRTATSFNAVVAQVSRGEADLGISKISRSLARAQAVSFSQPYMTLRHGLLVNRLAFATLAGDVSAAQVVRDFKGSLGVIAKSSFHDFSKVNFPAAQVREYPNWNAVVDAVQKGEVVAGYRDEFEVKRVLTLQPKLALTMRSITIKDQQDSLGIAVGADAPALLAYVNLFLETQHKKLSVQDILAPQAAGAPTGASR